MSATPPPTPPPTDPSALPDPSSVPKTVPQVSGPPRRDNPLGGLPELLGFLLAAIGLNVIIPILGGALIAAYLVMATGASKSVIREALEGISTDAFVLVPIRVVVSAATIGLVYLFVRVLRGLNFSEAVALRTVRAGLLLKVLLAGAALAVAVSLVNVRFPPEQELPIEKIFVSRAAVYLILGMAILAAPLAEELVFRGYVYTLIESRWNMAAAILTSGLMFGAIHFPQLWPGYVQMATLCVVGLAFSAARALTGSTTAAIFMHVSYNSVIFGGFMLSDQYRDLPAGMLGARSLLLQILL